LSKAIRKIIVEKKGSYILGIIFVALGILGLLGTLTITYLDMMGTWSGGVTKDFYNVLMESRNDQPIGLGLGIGITLLHYLISSIVVLAIGGGLLTVKGRAVPLVEEVTVTLRCPSCGNLWEESLSKVSLETMGYPRVKSLSRRKCAKCGRFIRPRITEVEGL